jgi:hypothetical protein
LGLLNETIVVQKRLQVLGVDVKAYDECNYTELMDENFL